MSGLQTDFHLLKNFEKAVDSAVKEVLLEERVRDAHERYFREQLE